MRFRTPSAERFQFFGATSYSNSACGLACEVCSSSFSIAADNRTYRPSQANEIENNTNTYVDFLTEFTGQDREEVYNDVG